jgi:hypothetical protein
MNATKKKPIITSEAFFSNEKYEIFILSKNLYKLKPRENVELDLQDGIEMRNIFLALSNGSKWAVLIDGANFFSTTSELRQLSANEEYTKLRLALAIVTKSMATKIIGNFFIKVNKPASPTKLFSEEKPAIEWLKQLLLNQQ